MKIKFAIVCDNAFTDNDGRLNIIQTFEIIRAASFPAIHPKLTVVTKVELESKEIAVETISQSTEIVEHNSGKVLIKSEPKEMNVSQKKNVQFIAGFIGLKFDKPGEYDVYLVINKKKTEKVTSFSVERIT